MTNPDDLTIFITRDGSELVTDSRAVALAFKKRHRDVLRTINKMRASKQPEIAMHAERSFAPSAYVDPTGRELPMFRMTAKGLSELAMGFTGEKSRVVRIRFLNAFDEMTLRLASAERSITERLFDLERRELPSTIKGQIGSRLMNERRREKPALNEERATLMAIAQPALALQ